MCAFANSRTPCWHPCSLSHVRVLGQDIFEAGTKFALIHLAEANKIDIAPCLEDIVPGPSKAVTNRAVTARAEAATARVKTARESVKLLSVEAETARTTLRTTLTAVDETADGDDDAAAARRQDEAAKRQAIL